MLASIGFRPRSAWHFDLYGGTILLAATRESDGCGAADASVNALLDEDTRLGVDDPSRVGNLQGEAESHVRALHRWLVDQRSEGRSVVGYGAASRSVALLCRAGWIGACYLRLLTSHHRNMVFGCRGRTSPLSAQNRSRHTLRTQCSCSCRIFSPRSVTRIPNVEESGGSWVDAEAL